jgi:ribosomal protein S18 acetylase RimI-like enzyme
MMPVEFEEWVGARFEDLGYKVKTTVLSGDHGVDIVARRDGEKAVIQCKQYRDTAVGEPTMRDLYVTMQHEARPIQRGRAERCQEEGDQDHQGAGDRGEAHGGNDAGDETRLWRNRQRPEVDLPGVARSSARLTTRSLVMEAARRNDFVGGVAFLDGIAVAMAYGAASKIGHWWYDTIAEALGSDHPALQSSWNLMELAVLSGFRRHGLATALLDDLLSAQLYPRALLSVIVHNAPARTFYENRGWRYLHSDLTFTATPDKRYAIMGRELR